MFTSEDDRRKDTTGLWQIKCTQNPCQTVSPQPDPYHKDDGNYGCKGSCGENDSGKQCFKLPPNTAFGLTAYANTDAHKQTVKLYIDDNLVDTYNGKGLNNTPMNNSDGKNTKVYHSGTGNVCVQIEGDGKPCKLRYSDNTLDGKPGFITIGAESGTDNDYNDSVVVLNWPLSSTSWDLVLDSRPTIAPGFLCPQPTVTP
ncbi:fucose-binding lectin II [Serratia sp. PAMC26656]|uniref:fucose-binding lectin II n=1 Tax=Serratia sp. PAMC26656 TaxID=2775909 RepID=UPI00351C1329